MLARVVTDWNKGRYMDLSLTYPTLIISAQSTCWIVIREYIVILLFLAREMPLVDKKPHTLVFTPICFMLHALNLASDAEVLPIFHNIFICEFRTSKIRLDNSPSVTKNFHISTHIPKACNKSYK